MKQQDDEDQEREVHERLLVVNHLQIYDPEFELLLQSSQYLLSSHLAGLRDGEAGRRMEYVDVSQLIGSVLCQNNRDSKYVCMLGSEWRFIGAFSITIYLRHYPVVSVNIPMSLLDSHKCHSTLHRRNFFSILEL